MKQVKNGFAPYYYINEQGELWNKSKETKLKPDVNNCFKLKLEGGGYKKIALKTLYKMVYNENYCRNNIEPLQGEEWRYIDRTDKLYMISSLGRCMSLQGYEAIILKPNIIGGYERVDIVQDGSRSSKLISRLVAAAFLMPPDSLDMQLHHKNGVKTCNAADNLVWLTPAAHRKIHKEMRKNSK